MDYVNKFEVYLDKEKKVSGSTLSAYMKDILEYEEFLKSKGTVLEKAKNENVQAFIDSLYSAGRSTSTVNRKLSSVRTFYKFMKSTGKVFHDPSEGIKSGKVERGEVEFLDEKEIAKLLDAPDTSAMGLRDKALLETMYATGLRAAEICAANIDDINFKIGYINVINSSKQRVVPLGKHAKAALSDYINNSRKTILGDKDDDGALFLSFLGERLTRQGIWKILKQYSDKLHLSYPLSPQIIRNTFAAHLIRNGADLKSLQDLLGHEDINATKIYLSVTKNRIMDVYVKAFPRA